MRPFLPLCIAACFVPIGSASGAEVARVSDQINFVGIGGIDGEINSAINCTAGVCSVYNELQFWAGDAVVRLVWTRPDNSVLLSGQIPWDVSIGEPNKSIGRRSGVAYVGWLAGTPAYGQFTGTADYQNSVGINSPCLGGKVCPQDYLEFDPGWFSANIPNPLPNFSPNDDAGSTQRQVAPLAASTGGSISTTWTLSDLTVPNGSPFGTEPTVTDVLQLTSKVEQLESGYRYSYVLTSQSEDKTAFAFDALGWNGNLDPSATAILQFESSLAPQMRRILGSSDSGNGIIFLATLDVLQPVPEPATWWMLGLGLAFVAAWTHIRKRSEEEAESCYPAGP